MVIEITDHARERMQKYAVMEETLKDAINNPDSTVKSYDDRTIYQKKLNGYVLRVIVEENKGIKRVITVYKARSGRHEIQI